MGTTEKPTTVKVTTIKPSTTSEPTTTTTTTTTTETTTYDPCLLLNCPENSKCRNSTCECNSGYKFDAYNRCIDIDECECQNFRKKRQATTQTSPYYTSYGYTYAGTATGTYGTYGYKTATTGPTQKSKISTTTVQPTTTTITTTTPEPTTTTQKYTTTIKIATTTT